MSPSSPARPRPRRGRLVLAALVLAGLGGAGYAYFSPASGSGPAANAALATAPVVRGDIEQTVTALATLKPKTYVDVGTQVSGLLRKIGVEIGDEVKKGDLLAQIDPTVYQTRVLGDQAQLDNLKAQLAQQEAQLDLDRVRDERAKRLLQSKAGSQDAADAAAAAVRIDLAKIDALKAQIKQTEATLQGDLANLGYTKIYAPMSGTVVSIDAREGQTLNANMTAPNLMRVADLDTMQVWAQVAEADIPKIKVGTEVYFTTLGMPDRRFTGKVVQVLPTPETVNDVVLYSVLVDVPNPERLLMTSMSAQVFFRLGSARNVLLVPTSAVQPVPRRPRGEGAGPREGRGPRSGPAEGAPAGKPAGNEAMVRVMVNGAPQERRVRTGISSRTMTEVVSGLEDGDIVVTSAPPAAQRPAGFGPPPRFM